MGRTLTRREAVKSLAIGAGCVAAIASASRAEGTRGARLQIDAAAKHDLSPYLFMQFMEPLGVTDGSVAAAWDHRQNVWRPDVVKITRDLEPTMVRWGGIFTDYYRWREGVGPRDKRPTMLNLMWGGIETNQVGTCEFVDFCRQVHAEPFVCVNFEADGRAAFKELDGQVRSADAGEAANWVAYCNDPDNPNRRGHGFADPLKVRFWQIGNETSYDRNGFDLATATAKTVEFAKAMKAADPSIQLIAWGDSNWAGPMLEAAGDHVDMLAFHHMFNPDSAKTPTLAGELYRRDPDATWRQLMDAWRINDAKIREVRDSLKGRQFPLAMTECHFTVPGRNRCNVMSTWATGVAYGRMLNNHQRHGDVLRIATAADFCGTRWQVNAVMIPVPQGAAYLMPVARVMKLYRHHIGKQALTVEASPPGLDVVASRTGETLYLHVVNTERTASLDAECSVAGSTLRNVTAYTIADDPMVEVSELNSNQVMQVAKKTLAVDGRWSFPPASVSAVEIELAA